MSTAMSLDESDGSTSDLTHSKLQKRSPMHAAANLGAAALLGSGALVTIALTTTAYFLALKGVVDLIFR